MEIEIQNCNNIDFAKIQIQGQTLNIKYAINGTGKSTISKAIQYAVIDRTSGTKKLTELTPFKALGDNKIAPVVSNTDVINSVKVFDETYLNEFVFQPDELLKGSFDIFIRDENYENGMREIDFLVDQIKKILAQDQDVASLINDFNELSGSFGKPTKTGIHNSSSLAKAFKDGNKVTNIPKGLEIFKDYIQNTNNFKWIKWQLEGKQFIDLTENCPYCVNDIKERKDKIKSISQVYEGKAIENMNKIIAVFHRLNGYFSDNTKLIIEDFIKNIDGYTNEQVNFLKEVKDQIDRLNEKFIQAQSISFFSLKDVDKVIERLKIYTIDIKLYNHLQSENTIAKVNIVNKSIEQLLCKAGELQGKINRQKLLIEKLVKENKAAINSFLLNAGYVYRVDLLEDLKGQHKLKLIHKDISTEVSDVKTHLSFGERNAFALVLFMFDALKSRSDLIILDDPISSFDKNKKYAIVEILFRKERSFRGKTVLFLSHDFEPIIDVVYHHTDRFEKPSAAFLENNSGILIEKPITKNDIQTFIDINKTNISCSINVISKLVYLRRTCEILNEKGLAYQIISNLLHKRKKPIIFENNTERLMTDEEIKAGNNEILDSIPEFNYLNIIEIISDDNQLVSLYKIATNNYEKLHIYRIIYDNKSDTIQSSVIQKFINQAFHIENDYIYQLNPSKYQTVPQYVIDECDKVIGV